MKILAIDCATNFGWATFQQDHTPGYTMRGVQRYGSINVKPREAKDNPLGDWPESPHQRHFRLFKAVRDLIKGLARVSAEGEVPQRYDYSDLWLVTEGSHGFSRGGNATKVANELRGVLGLIVGMYAIPGYLEIAPTTLKKFACGSGGSRKNPVTKEHMIAAARAKFGYKGRSDDEADALIILHRALDMGQDGLTQAMVTQQKRTKKKEKAQ